MRSGLIVQADLTRATGVPSGSPRSTFRHSPDLSRRLTPGADKGYDAAEFVAELREARVTPHIAQKSGYSAIDGRTARHKGYTLSHRHRKRTAEAFGWAKPAR